MVIRLTEGATTRITEGGTVRVTEAAGSTDTPTLLSPPHGALVDMDDGEAFTWVHNGDGAQDAYTFRRRQVNGGVPGAWEYWNGSGWVATETWVVSASESVTFAPGQW